MSHFDLLLVHLQKSISGRSFYLITEVFQENLQKVLSITEPVFFVKQHGYTFFFIETITYKLIKIGLILYSSVYF